MVRPDTLTEQNSNLADGQGPTECLRRLVLTNFRSYARAELRCDGRPVVLAGENGAGKTNILEAVSVLGPGRGLRGVRLSEMARRTEADNAFSDEGPAAPGAAVHWAVAATVQTAEGDVEIGTGLTPQTGERRQVRLKGAPAASAAALAEYLRVIWMTPAMDRLFTDSAGGRRRFLDRLVLSGDPAHGTRVNAYERVMRQRNTLLREGRNDPAWLAALEIELAEFGVAISAARRDLVGKLAFILDEDSSFPRSVIALDDPLADDLGAQAAVDVEQAFSERLKANRAQDAVAGRTLDGPHLADLQVRHRDKNMPAARCSTGEQKALLIGLIFAHARLLERQKGPKPVLLLDEVAAHLDERRRQALFDEICALGLQAWMTGTDRLLFKGLGDRAQWFSVTPGAVHSDIRPS